MKRAAAWLAMIWAALFAIVHLYWASGGRVGLGSVDAADAAFERSWFVIFNLGTAAGCVVAAGLALATMQARPRLVPGRLLQVGLWATATVLLVRGGVGVIQWLTSHRTAAEEASPLLALYDPWFVAGGVAYAILAWSDRSGSTAS